MPASRAAGPRHTRTPPLVQVAVIVVTVSLASLWFASIVTGVTPVGVRRFDGALSSPTPNAAPAGPNPFSSGMAANLVIGQPNFTSASTGHGPTNLTLGDENAVFDGSGDLWVADSLNNRVLEFTPPFSNGEAASLVLGQSSLTGSRSNTTATGLWEPLGIAIDAQGDLWVADSTNDRVLEYAPPFHTGETASLVLGQATFVTRNPGNGSTNLTNPRGLAFDAAGDLFVADYVNSRVVEFVPPFVSGMAASIVVGQSGFGTSGSATSPRNLSFPEDVAVDPSGNLWVADSGNRRVVEFLAPIRTGMAASRVLGQYTLTTTNETLPYGMSTPTGLSFDSNGDLWVADSNLPQNRVTEYRPPFSTNQAPIVVIGQKSFTGTNLGCNRTTFYRPTKPVFSPSGDLWVIDGGNSRILRFGPTNYSVTFTETGLPAATSWSVTLSSTLGTSSTASIGFSEWNGTYPFSVGAVSGYSATPTSGTTSVNGTARTVAIVFNGTTSGGGGGIWGSGSSWWLILILILVLLLILVALILRRRRKRTNAAPPPPAAGAL